MDAEYLENQSVRDVVMALMSERYMEGGSLGYEIVVRTDAFEDVRAESIYWAVLARIAQDDATDEDYQVEIFETEA